MEMSSPAPTVWVVVRSDKPDSTPAATLEIVWQGGPEARQEATIEAERLRAFEGGEPPYYYPFLLSRDQAERHTVVKVLDDDELDQRLLDLLMGARRAEEADQANRRTMSTLELAQVVNASSQRVSSRIGGLEIEGTVKESEAAPARWMVVLEGDG